MEFSSFLFILLFFWNSSFRVWYLLKLWSIHTSNIFSFCHNDCLLWSVQKSLHFRYFVVSYIFYPAQSKNFLWLHFNRIQAFISCNTRIWNDIWYALQLTSYFCTNKRKTDIQIFLSLEYSVLFFKTKTFLSVIAPFTINHQYKL